MPIVYGYIIETEYFNVSGLVSQTKFFATNDLTDLNIPKLVKLDSLCEL